MESKPKPNVLVPVTLRPSLSPVLRERFLAGVKALQGARFVTLVDEAPWFGRQGENYWARLARGRQAIIDKALKDDIDWVLWIDADISFDADVFSRLLKTSRKPGVFGAAVGIEGKPGLHYTTAGTRLNRDQRGPGLLPEAKAHEAFSVSGCVLVPADVHREVAFEPQPDEDASANTEWASVCIGARDLGFPVLWNADVYVEHANLPEYGEAWH